MIGFNGNSAKQESVYLIDYWIFQPDFPHLFIERSQPIWICLPVAEAHWRLVKVRILNRKDQIDHLVNVCRKLWV